MFRALALSWMRQKDLALEGKAFQYKRYVYLLLNPEYSSRNPEFH